ncbi:PhnD/SsuA/transferrin family substrate-binding protein [Thiomicrorhabdus cannonii]|uniref:PhnD/SsuA/transferrin family substrate-binding protein n=1 Tax=Thiomicrorhabdus cannonii TaxID=2748011 RepID=UPI0015B82BF0|nr:PhnD/SsuA/transferrin family substrate-binding protein [Thiomicrorhabdus cannonii]
MLQRDLSSYMILRRLILTFLLLAQLAPSQAEDKIRFAPLPMESLETMTREYLPFMDYLEKGMQRPFEMVYHKSYEALLEGFMAGKIDIAYLGPLPYVALKSKYDATKPIVEFLDENAQTSYTCALVKFAGDPLDLNAPATKKVALTQALSTCGYLSVESLLQNHHQSLESPSFSYDYVDSHDKVALKVILGEYRIGGLKTQIAKKYQHLGLRIIEETGPMPGFLLVGNSKTLDEATLQKIRDLILRMNPQSNPQAKEITKSWGPKIKNGAIPAQDSDYDSVREKCQATKIKLL